MVAFVHSDVVHSSAVGDLRDKADCGSGGLPVFPDLDTQAICGNRRSCPPAPEHAALSVVAGVVVRERYVDQRLQLTATSDRRLPHRARPAAMETARGLDRFSHGSDSAGTFDLRRSDSSGARARNLPRSCLSRCSREPRLHPDDHSRERWPTLPRSARNVPGADVLPALGTAHSETTQRAWPRGQTSVESSACRHSSLSRVLIQFEIAQCVLSAHWETLRALGEKRRKGAYTGGRCGRISRTRSRGMIAFNMR